MASLTGALMLLDPCNDGSSNHLAAHRMNGPSGLAKGGARCHDVIDQKHALASELFGRPKKANKIMLS
jgi:hypothetical protein